MKAKLICISACLGLVAGSAGVRARPLRRQGKILCQIRWGGTALLLVFLLLPLLGLGQHHALQSRIRRLSGWGDALNRQVRTDQTEPQSPCRWACPLRLLTKGRGKI
jgi:hypothetical protein